MINFADNEIDHEMSDHEMSVHQKNEWANCNKALNITVLLPNNNNV